VIVAFVAPQVICYTLAAVGAAVQQARGRFALASAAA
jgi:peptidoglycan biosynthesis protein MviN/MurJ (putative lipid II flippase)